MAHKKKKQDKLIAGFLALLTAFSPVASVVPVYATGSDGIDTSSVGMDPESITIDEAGSDSIVLDNFNDDASGITVIGDDNGESDGDSIIIENVDGNGDIQIDGEETDGINIGGTSDDGINIGKTSDDGIGNENPDDGI